ncbi:MAG: hypothetical protein WDA09_06755, partial [Bacteriovoracaceae bacterium]
MSGSINKEALFNEVKGSLFEYLVAHKLAQSSHIEIEFIQNIDKNYLTVLGQQDRMVRQFYPEMGNFLNEASRDCHKKIISKYGSEWIDIKLLGKLTNSQLQDDFKETDLLLTNKTGEQTLLSLKLNKKNSFVNTKSAGVRSFLTLYFPFLDPSFQKEFSKVIDLEFVAMSDALHRLHDLDYNGGFHQWVGSGLSELPGDLPEADREVLRKYYAKIARKLHEILVDALSSHRELFIKSLFPLMGFSDPRIVQVICFHDFKSKGESLVEIHDFQDVVDSQIVIREFKETASIEVESSLWVLQIRIKPMNK